MATSSCVLMSVTSVHCGLATMYVYAMHGCIILCSCASHCILESRKLDHCSYLLVCLYLPWPPI